MRTGPHLAPPGSRWTPGHLLCKIYFDHVSATCAVSTSYISPFSLRGVCVIAYLQKGKGRLREAKNLDPSHNPPLNVVPPTWASQMPRPPRASASACATKDRTRVLGSSTVALIHIPNSFHFIKKLGQWSSAVSLKTWEICVPTFSALTLELRKPIIISCPKPKNKLYSYKHEHHMNITKDALWPMGKTSTYRTATRSLEIYFLSHPQAIPEWHFGDRGNENVHTLICYL